LNFEKLTICESDLKNHEVMTWFIWTLTIFSLFNFWIISPSSFCVFEWLLSGWKHNYVKWYSHK